jgi:hypothetical protein
MYSSPGEGAIANFLTTANKFLSSLDSRASFIPVNVNVARAAWRTTTLSKAAFRRTQTQTRHRAASIGAR